jgi:hypothetical protein
VNISNVNHPHAEPPAGVWRERTGRHRGARVRPPQRRPETPLSLRSPSAPSSSSLSAAAHLAHSLSRPFTPYAIMSDQCPVYAPFFGAMVSFSLARGRTTALTETRGLQGCTASIVFTCALLC